MAKKSTAGRMKVLLSFILLFGPASLLIIIGTRGCEHKFKTLEDYGEVIDYSFTDAEGKQYTSKDFEGQVVLVSTLQITCPEKCEISMWHIKKHLYSVLNKNQKRLGNIKMISFVTDGEGNALEDVSAVNEMIKDQIEDYDPNLWIIASGESRELYNIKKDDKSFAKDGQQYSGNGFQKLLLLIDRKNHLRMVLPGDSEGMVRRMKEHMALLMKEYDKNAAKEKE